MSLLGMIVFPAFALFAPDVLGATDFSVVLLPTLFAGATLAIGLGVRARTSVTVISTLFCAGACFLAALVGSVFAAF